MRKLFVPFIALMASCGGPGASSSGAALTAEEAAAICAKHQKRACDPSQTKKVTICHIPPGNPENAHTLCIGSPALDPHVSHHADTQGPCACPTAGDPAPTDPDPPEQDPPSPPPSDSPTAPAAPEPAPPTDPIQ
jgi:hypothetical protein